MNKLHDLFRTLSKPLTPIPTGHPPHLPVLEHIRAILFDVYGTLVLSGAGEIAKDAKHQVSTDPVRDAVRKEGINAPDADWPTMKAHISRAHREAQSRGITHPEVDIRDIWNSLLPCPRNPGRVERLAIRCETTANPTWPEPTMAPTLRLLRNRGIVLGIVSNAQFYTPVMLEAYLECTLDEAGFDPALCFWSYQEGLAKPDRTLYLKAANALQTRANIPPDACAMVGNDVQNDIAPAAHAGFQTILYAGDQRSLRLRKDIPDCAAITPNATISSLAQLSDILPTRPTARPIDRIPATFQDCPGKKTFR